MADPSPFEDWMRVHQELVRAELAFSDLAMQHAQGEITSQQLDEARTALIAMRELCNAVYQKAFPKT